jgi:hypothetical protein
VVASRGLRPAEDQKILRLIGDPNESLTDAERDQIVQHIGNAGFKDGRTLLKFCNEIGPNYEGLQHPGRPGEMLTPDSPVTSADIHALKHSGRGGWPIGTTTAEYLADLKAIILNETECLHVGIDTGSNGDPDRAATQSGLTPRSTVAIRATFEHGCCCVVFYSPKTGKIVSGYPHRPRSFHERIRTKWRCHRRFPP